LEGVYFVNAAALFYLSAILEKHNAGSRVTAELTALTMPPALIEGTETVIFYSLFLLFPARVSALFAVFGAGVCISIVQRVMWAARHLDRTVQVAAIPVPVQVQAAARPRTNASANPTVD
jgi:hypothetical protein